MPFLDTYDQLTAATPELLVQAQINTLAGALATNPGGLFSELRANRPILVSKGVGPVIISTHREVVETLETDLVFSVAPYAKWITLTGHGPNYILGMDDGPQLDNDISVLRLAVKRTDLDRVRTTIQAAIARILAPAVATGGLDLADGLARYAALQLSADYFGVTGPDPQTLGRWTRAMFWAIFGNITADPGIAQSGVDAGGEFIAYLDGLIASLKTPGNPALANDTVISRLVAMQSNPQASFSDSRIRDNLIGTINGIIDNTNTAVNKAMDVLLSRPVELASATAAAIAGDMPLLLAHILEVMRFNPPAPIVARVSLKDYVLAKGTPRETLVPAGRVVIIATGSAMMDDSTLDAPLEFRLNRPYTDYLHFGWAKHQCFGRHISSVTLPEIIKSLLLLKNLRRAAGAAGQLTFAGPFPKSFGLEFDAAPASQP